MHGLDDVVGQDRVGPGQVGNGAGYFQKLHELGQFIEKQHPMMRQRDFSGVRVDIAAEQPGVTNRTTTRCVLNNMATP